MELLTKRTRIDEDYRLSVTYLIRILMYVFLFVFLIISITPFYWVFVSSFRNMGEIFSRPTIFPKTISFTNYTNLVESTNFMRWFFNSFFVATCFTLLGLFFCSLAGFGFAKFQFPFKRPLFWILLASLMLPIHVTIIPLFIIFARIGLVDTYWVLILPNSANAFGIFFMRQYIKGIPTDLIDAAKIDGCPDFRIYRAILLPIIKPAIGALTIFLFLQSWNNYLSPLIFMQSSSMFTLPVGLAALFGQFKVEYGEIMAGAVITVLPVIVVFLSLQKHFVAGLTAGVLKE